MSKLIYKDETISGSPEVVDQVQSGNMNAVTSNAVNGALDNYVTKSSFATCYKGTLTYTAYFNFTDDANITDWSIRQFILHIWNKDTNGYIIIRGVYKRNECMDVYTLHNTSITITGYNYYGTIVLDGLSSTQTNNRFMLEVLDTY